MWYTQLGYIMDLFSIQAWFPHPQIPNAKVHVIFDVCHMIKLMQNLLGDEKVICYEENGTIQRINWQYIEALSSVQEDPGLSLANRLKKQHFLNKTQNECENLHKDLAILLQVLLTSYKSKLIFHSLRVVRQQPHFIKQVAMICDMLNSRNPYEKGYKACVTKEILSLWLKQCDKILSYLLSLKHQRHKLLIEDPCKSVIRDLHPVFNP